MTTGLLDRAPNPFIKDGVDRLRSKWSQTHFEPSAHGAHLIIVPGVLLPKSYVQTICTVLFIAPPGFPTACPDHFFTDITIELSNRNGRFDGWPKYTLPYHNELKEGNFPAHIWPAWAKAMWWSWHLQHWSPNSDSLYTYMRVIEQRLRLAK